MADNSTENNLQQAMMAEDKIHGTANHPDEQLYDTELMVMSFVSDANSEDSLRRIAHPQNESQHVQTNEECDQVPEHHSQHNIAPQSNTAGEISEQKFRSPRYTHVKAICIFLTVLSVVAVCSGSAPIALFVLFGSDATFFGTSNNSTVCQPELYMGQVCRNILLPNITRSDGEIFIASVADQEATESMAVRLISKLNDLNPELECEEQFVSFVCLSLFGRCDGGALHLPSFQECANIMNMCQQEWVEIFNTTDCLDVQYSPVVNTTSIICQEDFFVGESGLCRAECGRFEYWPHHIENIIFIAQTSGTSLGIIVCVVMIVIVCIRYKTLLRFPSILIVHQTLSFAVFEITVLIASFDKTALFCSSEDLEESFHNPTPFCTFSGMVFHYIGLQISLWWTFHIASLFWSLRWPLHFRMCQRSGKLRYVYIIMTMLGLLLPIVSAVVPLAHRGYSFSKAPPVFCIPVQYSDNVYSLVIPFGVIGGAGLFLLLHVFWLIIKHKRLIKSGKFSSLTVPEVKILFILSSVLFGGVALLVAYSIEFFNISTAVEALDAYLDCESTGIVPGKACDRGKFGQAYNPSQAIFDLVIVFGFLYPCVNMLYVVEVQQVKTKIVQCCTF